jgi:hypothetical protein
MLQSFNRNNAQLIMGLGAPICVSLDLWEDILLFLKDQDVITFDISAKGIYYRVNNDFSLVFDEQTKYVNQTIIHEFRRDSEFDANYVDSIKAELAYFGYKSKEIFGETNADNFFDED